MYQRILVPTDGSEPSEQAAEHAIDLAAAFDATVDALFVVEDAVGHWDMAVEKEEEAGERALDAIAVLGERHGVTVNRHLRRGRPAAEMVDAAAEYGADLIVMGTQGRTGFSRIATAGSTTERVVRLTAVPTLVVGGSGAARE
jgi:nucleotide-binding universal stress UspA family protein